MAVNKKASDRHSEAKVSDGNAKDTRRNIRKFIELGRRFISDNPALAEFVTWGVTNGHHLEMWNLLLIEYGQARDKAARLRIGGMIACLFIKSASIRNSVPLDQILKLFASRDRMPINDLLREIPGFPDYFASISGRIISMKHNDAKFIKPTLGSSGYPSFTPCNGGRKFNLTVHRAVAQAYLPPIEGKEQVNHKDLNKENSALANLERVSPGENIQHYKENSPEQFWQNVEKRSRAVVQLTMSGEIVAKYRSLSEASKQTGIALPNISNTVNGRKRSAGGFRWE